MRIRFIYALIFRPLRPSGLAILGCWWVHLAFVWSHLSTNYSSVLERITNFSITFYFYFIHKTAETRETLKILRSNQTFCLYSLIFLLIQSFQKTVSLQLCRRIIKRVFRFLFVSSRKIITLCYCNDAYNLRKWSHFLWEFFWRFLFWFLSFILLNAFVFWFEMVQLMIFFSFGSSLKDELLLADVLILCYRRFLFDFCVFF